MLNKLDLQIELARRRSLSRADLRAQLLSVSWKALLAASLLMMLLGMTVYGHRLNLISGLEFVVSLAFLTAATVIFGTLTYVRYLDWRRAG